MRVLREKLLHCYRTHTKRVKSTVCGVTKSVTLPFMVCYIVTNKRKGKDMTRDDIIMRAASNTELPDNEGDVLDVLLWYKMRDVYRQHAIGEITAEEGARKKVKLLRWYEQERHRMRMKQQCDEQHAINWARIEAASRAYAHEPSIETGDAFFEAIYGCRPARRQNGGGDMHG